MRDRRQHVFLAGADKVMGQGGVGSLPGQRGLGVVCGESGSTRRGKVARLLDRGYQKFVKTPSLSCLRRLSQLQGIHLFSEEFKQLTGAISLYNESLRTTSDMYEYDRLKGRKSPQPEPARPGS